MSSNASPAQIADHQQIAPEAAFKESELRRLMRSMKTVLVAYSGGVDSAYLAYIANQELARNALSVLGVSPSVSASQLDNARRFARETGLNFIEITTDELDDENYTTNPANRCFYCKSELYSKLRSLSKDRSFENILDGTNADDLMDHRPGRNAATQMSVRSPLAEIGFTKEEIRELSFEHGLKTWDKPSSPCLSSRIAYGIPVTLHRLGQVEKSEALIRSLGFREFRVRVHGDLARIEISIAEIEKFLDPGHFGQVVAAFKSFGFKHITLDLEGFRSGSLN